MVAGRQPYSSDRAAGLDVRDAARRAPDGHSDPSGASSIPGDGRAGYLAVPPCAAGAGHPNTPDTSYPEPDSAPGLPTAARSGAYPVSDGSAAAGREPRGLLQPTHAPPDGAASAAWSAHTGSPRAQRQPARGPDGPPMVERLAAGPANRARSPARSTRQRRLPDPRARANARVRLGRRFRPAGGSGPRVWRPCSGAG